MRQAQDATGQWLLATQDGYVASHGLLQERRLFVDARGQEVRGEDILTVADARARVQFERAGDATAASASPRASTCTRRSRPSSTRRASSSP